jgi:hypothetical protein
MARTWNTDTNDWSNACWRCRDAKAHPSSQCGSECWFLWNSRVVCRVCGEPSDPHCLVCKRRFCRGCFALFAAKSRQRRSTVLNVGYCFLDNCFSAKLAHLTNFKKQRSLKCARNVSVNLWLSLFCDVSRQRHFSRDVLHVILSYVWGVAPPPDPRARFKGKMGNKWAFCT